MIKLKPYMPFRDAKKTSKLRLMMLERQKLAMSKPEYAFISDPVYSGNASGLPDEPQL